MVPDRITIHSDTTLKVSVPAAKLPHFKVMNIVNTIWLSQKQVHVIRKFFGREEVDDFWQISFLSLLGPEVYSVHLFLDKNLIIPNEREIANKL